MKAITLSISIFAFASQVFAADCQNAAVEAAANYAIDSADVYHCVASPSDVTQDGNRYQIALNCVGEGGSARLSYTVTFDSDDACTSPVVTPN